ncbi:hypothetical protein CP02DC21_1543B, partial [Chlamydia psittaci 02DC21]
GFRSGLSPGEASGQPQ